MKDRLDEKFNELLVPTSGGVVGPGTNELRKLLVGTATLGKAILRLDRTSSSLATANLWLGLVIAAIGVIQIVLLIVQIHLMLNGH